MYSSFAFALFLALALLGLWAIAARDHRAALADRMRLLDPIATFVRSSQIAPARDGFPVLSGALSDGRLVRIELIPDTLVFRRLPQLWLVVEIHDKSQQKGAIGALVRPTGTEFYSHLHTLAERLDAAGFDMPIMLRGDGRLGAMELARAMSVLRGIFSDPRVKEVLAGQQGMRIVRQADEGERGAHLLLRQVRFPAQALSCEVIKQSIADLDALRDAIEPPRALVGRFQA